ncbi:MAG: PIN domain-containing protein [Gemmatimonadetes bacterium]|nr:PIN domain-containing protein [Gemmatimonadota bacterium]MXZ09983.1 PIN domain-containing protein [Gemmatimonadota bacterium]MYB57418.1 PIN domain-containing protein [Gemmatimonadota bacterium]MYD64278.1 PIN domain-containing protein [Gemmatimonadota bacterium]MYF16249.1 PIN domain-containing protein [Gemmatimonadota bacterium]
MSNFRCVIDTNVLFEGLTQKGGAAGLLIDAWLSRTLDVCVSNALAYEYAEVLSRQLSPHRWQQMRPVLETLLDRARFVTIYYSWRPISPDPGDDHVIDCAMNAGATVITSNLRDFQSARIALGLRVLTPVEAILHLLEGEDEL